MKIQMIFISEGEKYFTKPIKEITLEEAKQNVFDNLEKICKLELELENGQFMLMSGSRINNGLFIFREVNDAT